MEVELRSKKIHMVPVKTVVPHPKNANRHSLEQIERLAKIIQYQGFRNPLVVSKRSGFLASGHGRLEAARFLKMQTVPVIFQEFESEAQEYAYVISDNEIARWAELDKHMLIEELKGIDIPEFELLGLESIESLKATIMDEPDVSEDNDNGRDKETVCPNCGEKF